MDQIHKQFRKAASDYNLNEIKRLIEIYGYPEGPFANTGDSFMTYIIEFSSKYRQNKDQYQKFQDLLNFMIDKGANPSYAPSNEQKFRTSIYWAVYHKMYEVVELLLKRGVSARQTESDTLGHSLHELDEKMIALLVKNGADVNVMYNWRTLIDILERNYGKTANLSNDKRKRSDNIKIILTKGYDCYEKIEQQRLERERLERERLERERLERERLEREKLEQQRLERERLERERLELKNKIKIASDHLGNAFANIKYLEDNKYHLSNNSKKKLIQNACISMIEAKKYMPNDIMKQIIDELPKKYQEFFDIIKVEQ